jgi:nitrite reductase/ring-hydroxylating ferredoxin subunit
VPATAAGPADGDGWHPLRVGAAPGQVEQVTVADVAVLVCNLGGAPYAYRDGCPTCGADFSGGALHADVLRCAGCAAEYDVRLAGRAVSGAVANLEPLPLLPDGDSWRLALPQRALA